MRGGDERVEVDVRARERGEARARRVRGGAALAEPTQGVRSVCEMRQLAEESLRAEIAQQIRVRVDGQIAGRRKTIHHVA